jgi:cellulose synthase/poly-beta-1,6-N-acetylglucosamine synthase-like glycosyltransferase
VTWVIVSTIALIISLGVAFWVHNQHQMAIQVLPAAPPAGVLPRISVIVPARNEERNIAACLAALQAQTYPNLEIIVVDDHSPDRTPQILAAIGANRPARAGHHRSPAARRLGRQTACPVAGRAGRRPVNGCVLSMPIPLPGPS